jgi:hypothetical protein
MATANFVVKAAPGATSVPHPRLGTVPVAGMSEKRMLALWLSGSPYVTITPAGLKAYGKQLTTEQRERAELQVQSPAKAGAPKPAPEPPPAKAEPREETGETPASAGAAPEEADERPRKRGRRGDDTPERASAAE